MQIASISQGDMNFRFYVAGGGKFGDINSGSNINLPAGTLILSAADNGPIFITDTAYTLNAADTQQYVGAYSAAPGSAANASAGVFNNAQRHSDRQFVGKQFSVLGWPGIRLHYPTAATGRRRTAARIDPRCR